MTKLFFKDQQKIFNFYFIFKKNNAFFSITDNRGYVYKQINIGSVRYGDSSTELKFKNKRLKLHFSSYFSAVFPLIKKFKQEVINFFKKKRIKVFINLILKGFRRYKKKLLKKILRVTYIRENILSFLYKPQIPHNGCKKKNQRRKKKKKLIVK